MAVIIGSARHDENGKYSYGMAGDQTGEECSTQPFYVHSKGWIVIRAKDADIALHIAQAMSSACNNNNIGYDQSNRLGLYNASRKYGYDPMQVTEKTETDCSALVRVCCLYAGVSLPDFTTADEVSVLKSTGKFDVYDYVNGFELCNGDIICTKTKGHTCVVVGGGKARSVYPLGWNYGDGKWWYQYGYNREDYYSNCVAVIKNNYYAFDKEGYMKENSAVINMDENGAIIGVD